jgi:regulator of RNase E activity RraA
VVNVRLCRIGDVSTSASERIAASVLERARQVSTATVSSVLQKRGFANMFIRQVFPLRPELRMAGQAFTLRYIPAREDLVPPGDTDNSTNKQRLAVEAVGVGEVLVIDARGYLHAGTLGDILTARIKARGASGIVTDGSFRDTPSMRKIDLPTYARGQSPYASTRFHFPVDINVPIGCGGVAIMPGDVLIGDGEGVVVVPRQVAESVVDEAFEHDQLEEFIMMKIQSGASILNVYPPGPETMREYEQWKTEDRR